MAKSCVYCLINNISSKYYFGINYGTDKKSIMKKVEKNSKINSLLSDLNQHKKDFEVFIIEEFNINHDKKTLIEWANYYIEKNIHRSYNTEVEEWQ